MEITRIDGTESEMSAADLAEHRGATKKMIEAARARLCDLLVRGGEEEREIREELAVLYPNALTLGMDPLTLVPRADAAIPPWEASEWSAAMKSDAALIAWGRREAGL